MDWDKLRIFHAVADAGSLTHAGDTLHLSQSAVSRQIRALEESLNTTLFRRHARGLLLTEQGELLFETTRSMTKRLDATAARIRDSEDEVFGELRVTTTTGFGTLWLAPRLHRLFERYPNLKIDLMLEERILDLPMREADVAIRLKEPSQAELIRRRLMEVHIRLYASKEYVEAHGLPTKPDDLAGHRIITQSPNSPQVRAGADFVQPFLAMAPASSLTVNNYFGILQGVIHGLGIGSLPDYLTGDFPRLVHILPEEKSAPIPTYLAYVEELRHSKRVCAFRDFVVDEISAYKRGERLGSAGTASHALMP
jgi:DNA-binding transcriptional LysR family regulator